VIQVALAAKQLFLGFVKKNKQQAKWNLQAIGKEDGDRRNKVKHVDFMPDEDY
jgi:hypothetical protein